MLVLNQYEETVGDLGELRLLGVGLISIKSHYSDIIYIKGLGKSLVQRLFKLYEKKIKEKKNGKIIDLMGFHTVYVHYFTKPSETLVIIYINEKDKLVPYQELCSLSEELVNIYYFHHSVSDFSKLLKKVIPNIQGVLALFVLNVTGHSFITKIGKDQNFLKQNSIQVGGFISAISIFSEEVIAKDSGEHLEAITFENFSFFITKKDELLIAYLVKKNVDCKIVKRYIELIAEEFIETYGEEVMNFSGDINQFKNFTCVIDKYFEI
jgi:hypothetical protein